MQWWKKTTSKASRVCLKDVEITKKVFDYALKNGTLIFKELGIKKEVKLDTSKWLASPAQAGAALTKTLGF